MSTEDDTRSHLIESLKKRGTQARIAEALGVTAATVKRWNDGEIIPPPMIKLLRLYFFGELPFELVREPRELSSVLEFSPDEWRIIEILARREGQTPTLWIRSQIRGYLNHNPRAIEARRDSIYALDPIESSMVAEDTPQYGGKPLPPL